MKKFFKVFIAIVILLAIASGIYVNSGYKAEQQAVIDSHTPSYDFVGGTILEGDIIAFIPKDCKKGIVLYPGGLVDEKAYMLYARSIADKGIACIICSMPCDLAVLGMDKANVVLENYPEIEHWYIAGHSLGGAMASTYLKKNADKFEGLILLAAYSTSNLTNTNLKTLSIYGSNDQVMNRDKYAKYYNNLPNLTEIVIEGGNHSGFGNYGHQKGDGVLEISSDEQREITVEAIVNFVNQ